MSKKNNDPIHFDNSPMKFIGAVAQLAGGLIGRGKKKDALDAANTQAGLDMEAYRNTENTNPYADMKNQFGDLENTMEDLTVNTQEADMKKQMMEQQQANMMGSMEQAGGFDAGNIQAMMGAADQSAQSASASIGAQESANTKASAQAAGANQMASAQGAASVDMASAQGESERQSRQADMNANLMSMSREDQAAAQGAVDQSTADIVGGGAGLVGSMFSDRDMKKNIKKVGKSPSGLNVYNYEYKNTKHGKGTFQGVMSDEIPSYAVVSRKGKPDIVNYNLIDVVAKSVKGTKK